MDFTNIIQQLLQDNNITAKKMSIDLGLSVNAMSEWKKGRIKPSIETISKIADYFNVSTDYLLGKTDVKTKADEDITFNDFTYAMYNETKELSEEQKNDLLEMARIFKKHLKEKNKE